MANTKKYVSLDKLELYNDKIKKVITDADAAALASANAYADSLASNYDAAGAAATALDDAKAYADGKDTAIAEAKKAGTDAAAAAKAADDKAVAAQGEVDALELYVGTIPEGATATNVVAYVQEKTAGIATEGAMTELGNRVGVVEGKVATIEGDYLKAADKTELEGKITAVETAVATEKSRAEGIESGLRTDVDEIKEDYLKAADKTELSDAIAEEKNRAEGIESGLQTRIKAIEDDYLVAADKEALQTQINTIMNNPDAEGAINSINEFTQYVKDHGTIADGFRTDIDKNKEDIAANTKAIADQATSDAATYATKTELANEKKALQDEIDADVKVVADDLADLSGVVEGINEAKADKTALESAIETLEGVDTGLDNRLKAVEAQLGDGENSVSDLIATAKQEAIDAAAGDATSKANTAEQNAKTYADGLDTAMNGRVEALEAIDHEHANKALLDTYTQTEANLADAVAKKHAHGNFEVLEGITSAKVTAWDAAEGNAKTYANGLNTAMDTRVTAIETWHENFVEVSEDEINKLFA